MMLSQNGQKVYLGVVIGEFLSILSVSVFWGLLFFTIIMTDGSVKC